MAHYVLLKELQQSPLFIFVKTVPTLAILQQVFGPRCVAGGNGYMEVSCRCVHLLGLLFALYLHMSAPRTSTAAQENDICPRSRPPAQSFALSNVSPGGSRTATVYRYGCASAQVYVCCRCNGSELAPKIELYTSKPYPFSRCWGELGRSEMAVPVCKPGHGRVPTDSRSHWRFS